MTRFLKFVTFCAMSENDVDSNDGKYQFVYVSPYSYFIALVLVSATFCPECDSIPKVISNSRLSLYFFQNYNKDSVVYVQQHLTKNEVPTDLFEVSI